MDKRLNIYDIDLQLLVEKVSLDFFARPFLHQAIWNSRLRTTGGRYHLKSHDLDFNPNIYAEFGADVFLGIVKHELCHYHLHLSGKGYKHRDAEFRQLLATVDGSRFAPRSASLQPKYLYECRRCHNDYRRQRRINLKKYVCGKCGGRLLLIP